MVSGTGKPFCACVHVACSVRTGAGPCGSQNTHTSIGGCHNQEETRLQVFLSGQIIFCTGHRERETYQAEWTNLRGEGTGSSDFTTNGTKAHCNAANRKMPERSIRSREEGGKCRAQSDRFSQYWKQYCSERYRRSVTCEACGVQW